MSAQMASARRVAPARTPFSSPVLSLMSLVFLAALGALLGAPTAAAESRTVFEHSGAIVLSHALNGCIETQVVVGGLDRVVINQGAPVESSYLNLGVSEYDQCAGTFTFQAQAAEPSYGVPIANDAFIVDPNGANAQLRLTAQADVLDVVAGIWVQAPFAIDVTWSRTSPSATPQVSGTIEGAGRTFVLDASSFDASSFALIYQIHAIEVKEG